LESGEKEYEGAQDAIKELEKTVEDFKNIWRDTYIDLEKRTLDALVASYQKVIDKYSELNDTINDGNNNIINSIQEQISLEREARQNEKTE